MNSNVAVVIPTLNEEKFIARCLDSVINQTYSFSEMDVIVVDGGSSNRTCEIVNEYHEKYSNIRLLENPGRIQSIAFNIGVKNSTAPYVVRLDAHALYKPFYIEGCVIGLEENAKRGNVGGQWDIQPQNGSLWAKTNAVLNFCKFVKEVLPAVDVDFMVVGKDMATLKSENSCLKDINVLSNVPDLSEYFLKADIIISPIFSGSGMKVKTCEGLMYGKNILGSNEAFEGYDIDYGKVGGLCNTSEEYISTIKKIIEKPIKKFNTYSRECYENKYSNSSIQETFNKIFLQ